MKISRFFPHVLSVIFLYFLISLSYFRVQFWIFNHSFFESDGFDFLKGLRFDLSLIGYLFLVLTPIYFLGYFTLGNKKAVWVTKWLSMLFFTMMAFTECWDLIYFQYTLKRCSFDLYFFYLGGGDQAQVFPWLAKFWYVVLAFILANLMFYLGIRRIKIDNASPPQKISNSIFSTILILAVSFGLARSSWGLKPLGILDANDENPKKNPSLVLNAPFVVLKTIQNKGLPNVTYLSLNDEHQWFNPIIRFTKPQDSAEQKPNLVFLVIESLGMDQLGQSVDGVPITPFLDSLVKIHGKNIEGFAEGKTTIEALPSLFTGIPSWQEQPFILSDFSLNQCLGFPSICKKLGYNTCFFHGANGQSMRFDAVQRSLGFDKAFFKEQVPHTSTDLGSWGIHDKPMLNFMLNQLNQFKNPFMAAFFSLSTHEPYDLPSGFLKKFPKFSKEQASYRYLDDALRSFFQMASKAPWFQNTLFVITGDHTPVHLDGDAKIFQDYFKIPILMFYPNKGPILKHDRSMGHCDVIPTICSINHWNVSLYGFGSHVNQDQIRYFNGIHYIWNKDYTLRFNEKKQQWLSPIFSMQGQEIHGTSTLKQRIYQSKMVFFAKLQRFRRDLRNNTCRP